ncbi:MULTISPECIES: cell division protein ZapA [unclassified Candidatus Lariskella]|uniref:cell division protein ZapA n=1 Tax=unclassified Candidatus Lariskella TaxID=2632605 RepID=UPI0030CD04C7
MSKVTVQFGSGVLDVHCEDPNRVKYLANKINERIAALKSDIKNVNDSRALFLAALIMQDEIETLKSGEENAQSLMSEKGDLASYNEHLLEIIDDIANYLEEIANNIQTNSRNS